MRSGIGFVTAAALSVLAGNAAAQPVQPMPTTSTPVGDVLAASPIITIGNGHIRARIAPPDLRRGFYRGTRFDQAGVITSLKLNGHEFYGPWFERTAPEVLDYAYDASGAVVAGPDSAVSGPVEEFAPLGFEARPGVFVKPGVGVLRQPDNREYDKYRHYEIVDGGRRTTHITANGVTFTQILSGGDYGYVYEKTLTLVIGADQMVIEHVLKNTGNTPIHTTVYDHNFLRLVSGNNGIRVTFPFAVTAAVPPPADLIHIQGRTLTYLRAMANKERLSFPVTGYGATAADYDIAINDPAGGAGVRMMGNAPVTRVNIFSIDRTQAVEPSIAIDVAPGATQSWRYTYTYTAPR